MNVSIAISAVRMGGSLVNYTECVELMKEKDEKGKDVVCGAKIKDRITGKYEPRQEISNNVAF